MPRTCCQACGATYQVSPDLIGREIKCRECGKRVPVLADEFCLDDASIRVSHRTKTAESCYSRQTSLAENVRQRSWIWVLVVSAFFFTLICIGGIVIAHGIRGWPQHLREISVSNGSVGIVQGSLTREEEIAWQKLRNHHQEKSYRIFGYLSEYKHWRAYSLDLKSESLFAWKDNFGYAFRDEEHPNSEYMKAQFLEQTILTGIPSGERNIEQARRELAEREKRYGPNGLPTQLARRDLSKKIDLLEKSKSRLIEVREIMRREENRPIRVDGLAEAEAKARSLASLPRIQAIAIVDPFSEVAPAIIEYAYDDSTGARIYSASPVPALGLALEGHLLSLQRRANEFHATILEP